MSEEIKIDNYLSDKEKYEMLLPQVESLLNDDEPIISNLANVTAALKQTFPKISWVGFYFLKDGKLYLGPFQGNTACTIIKVGNGVCGTSAEKKETIIVGDVDKFPGHIACDSGSKSEIVLPIISDNQFCGVLDLDSYEYSSFNENDKFYLEKLCKMLASKLELSKFVIT